MAISLPLRASAFHRIAPGTALVLPRESFFVMGLVALALAVRWPNLLLQPQFPSVGGTVLRALDIADGRAFPLADQAPYLGSVFIYMLAAVYRLFGPGVETTLLVPWLLGGLTMVPTYLLGREIGGRMVGLLAGGLLATSSAHTLVSSHVPLSHSITPLFAALTLWLLVRSGMRRDGRCLALAGLSAGLTLQTHPTVAPLLLGAASGLVLQRPGWLRTRWPYLALALVVLGYGTLLAHHVQTRFEIVGDIQGKQARYLDADVDTGEQTDHGVYLNNLEQLLLSLTQLTSGAIEDRGAASEYLFDPAVMAYPALALAGLAVAARRGGLLLPLALLPAILLPPLLSGKYKPILDGRYLMPLLPVLFVGIGLALAAAADLGGAGRRRLAAGAALAVTGAFLMLHPLASLAAVYKESQEDGFSNSLYLATLDQLESARAAGEPVLLDARLNDVKSAGGGKAGSSFTWLLAVSRVPTETYTGSDGPAALAGDLAVLHRSTAERVDDELQISPLDGGRPDGRSRQSYRAYRVSG